ncbi:MAG TPA: TauD/TfdA family dioxygenase [Gammaproteobacteria bacterium]|jgi:taurine dioxygenase|nr:TauD/TfdA family dioxygenase [Gammaproteobacteria bacterium]
MRVNTLSISDIKKISMQELNVIRKYILQDGLVILRNQSLTPIELHEVTSQFGEPIILPKETSSGEQDNHRQSVVRVSNFGMNGTFIKGYKGAVEWHTDSAYFPNPLNYTWNFLYGEIIPQEGGETAFANCQEAYHTLDADLKKYLVGKKIIVDPNKIPNFSKTTIPFAEHEILALHKESGKETLYVSGPTDVITIKNLSDEQSRELMEKLHDHVLKERNLYIHKWCKGDLLIWDNLVMLHRSLGNYGNQPRLLYRTQARMTPE